MLTFIITLGGLIAIFIMSSRTTTLNNEIERLKKKLQDLLSLLEKEGIDVATLQSPEEVFYTKQRQEASPQAEDTAVQQAGINHDKAIEEANDVSVSKLEQVSLEENTSAEPEPNDSPWKESTEATPVRAFSFEHQFGARLPVWVAGIAFALAGLFLVKYSIQNNLLTPLVRVLLGGLLGGALLYSASWVRKRPNFANGIRIAQSLSGAGIAILYISVFAATSYYQLLPNVLGFLSMAVITAVAVVLSLRHGPPIALLGLIGGFLTPALVGSKSPSAALLFVYLYLLFVGLMFILKRQKWWDLSILMLLGNFLWIGLWLESSFTPSDTIWLGLFLLATSLTIIIFSKTAYEEEATKRNLSHPVFVLNAVGLSGAVIWMGIIAGQTEFGLLGWLLFCLLAVGGIVLAYFNDKLYGFVPWVSMLATVVMLCGWQTPDKGHFALTLVVFAFIYIASGYFLMWRTRLPLLWAGLMGATSMGFYLLAYFTLGHIVLLSAIPFFWGILAFLLAGAAIYVLYEVRRRYGEHPHKEYILAIFAVVSTTFISIGLTIGLSRMFLSVAFALEMLAVSWINYRTPIKALRFISMVLALIFVGLMSLHWLDVLNYTLSGTQINVRDVIPMLQWPIFELGVPAIMFFGASYFLRLERDDAFVQALELAAAALFAIMGYCLMHRIPHNNLSAFFAPASFTKRGVITNIFFIYGLGCFIFSRSFKRIAFSWAAMGLCALVLFRIIYFDLLLYNPLWAHHQRIGGWFIFNSLLLPYGLPLLWTWFASKELSLGLKEQGMKYIYGFMLLLSFVLISLNVRYFFHGEYLNLGNASRAEIYSYSVVWLLFGVGLLFVGTLRSNKILRYSSLGVMILTVAKVFLYDASVLDGLYRVFSFFGLGISLLGLSWFYTRFVFNRSYRDEEQEMS